MTHSDQAPQNTQGDELDAIVDFLCGKSALDGMWFGEKLANRPAFWWRKRLRKAVSTQREQAQHELLIEMYGEKCEEYVSGCAACEVWRDYESKRTSLKEGGKKE